MQDLRDKILGSLVKKLIAASMISNDRGVMAGTIETKKKAESLGLTVHYIVDEGSKVEKGMTIANFRGDVRQLIIGEDVLLGFISKPSGIATAAYRFTEAAGNRLKIVSGAWKKMPLALKETIRNAVITGGAHIRISENPFIYLDKNYVEIFGGIKESLKAVAHLNEYVKVVQLKGKYKDIALEGKEAVQYNADIVFIDTGNHNDIKKVAAEIRQLGLRDKTAIAFGGGITLEDVGELKSMDVDILDIGREIIDAPLLDIRYEIGHRGDGE